MLETQKILVLSTAHVAQEETEWLEEATEDAEGLVIFGKGEFGWFIHTSCLLRELPENVERCLQLAEDTGHEWLCLDRDGDTTDLLPTYDW